VLARLLEVLGAALEVSTKNGTVPMFVEALYRRSLDY